MLRQKPLWILSFIYLIYSCKCQDLEKYVAPILDNRGAPLVAIVDTSNISSHIVRSIEMPLREIINSTVECKINEKLKEGIVSSQVLRNVNDHLDTLQQNIDKHIGDNRDKFIDVKQDIASLRIDTEASISHEILKQKKNFTKLVNALNLDLEEKMKNLTSNVIVMQSGVQKKIDKHIEDNRNKNQCIVVKEDIATLRKEMKEKITHEILENMKNFSIVFNTVNKDLDEKVKNLRETILSVDSNLSNLSEQLKKQSNRLDALYLNIQELTVNTRAIQSDMNKVRSTVNINNGKLGGHDSRLDNLNSKVNDINSRAFLSAWVPSAETMSSGEVIPFTTIKAQHGISSVSSMTSRGVFTCEKSGYYLVSFFVTSKSSKAAALLYRGSTKIARTTKSGDSYYESHAAMTITQLNTGDTLSVKADINDMNVYNTYDSGFTILQIY